MIKRNEFKNISRIIPDRVIPAPHRPISRRTAMGGYLEQLDIDNMIWHIAIRSNFLIPIHLLPIEISLDMRDN